MTKQTIFFLLSVSVVTLALSFLTAYIYTKVFPMSIGLSRGVKIAGVVFPFLFVVANAISRFSNLSSVKWFYVGMSTGAGIAFYLMLGALILGICLVICKIIGVQLSVYVSWLVFVLAVGVSLLGLFQARDIKKVSYEVSITNLPSEWQGKRAILFSDSHYGLVNHEKAAKRLTNRIAEENPDMVFIAGDLFDGPDVDTDPLINLWKQMSLKHPVFYAPGNHEEYGNYGKFLQAVKDANFNVLEDKAMVYEGMNIVGLMYRAKNQEDEVSLLLKRLNVNQNLPTIVINHPPTFQKTLEQSGVDLMFSGHTHRGQFWPLRYITKAIYGVYHYGLNSYGDLQVMTTSGVGTAGPPVRLFNTPEIVEVIFVSK